MIVVIIIGGFIVVCFVRGKNPFGNQHTNSDIIYVLVNKVEEKSTTAVRPRRAPSAGPELDLQETFSWSSLPNVAGLREKLEFRVGPSNFTVGVLSAQERSSDRVFEIVGKPCFCQYPTEDAPEEMTFSSTKFLVLSEMAECTRYTQLILKSWWFPHVHHTKLNHLTINRGEFEALVFFIDRHNRTLGQVDINDSYICPSPDCDAGLINYPDHDFRIKITKRRVSPN